MQNTFLRWIEWWLPVILREKAVESAREQRLCFIGAADLAKMITDYVLTEITANPVSCWTACGLDQVSDDDIENATSLSPEVLAAAFVGAAVDLAPWQGEPCVTFLIENDVPADAAREVAAAVEVVAEKLGVRGRNLILAIDARLARTEQVMAPAESA